MQHYRPVTVFVKFIAESFLLFVLVSNSLFASTGQEVGTAKTKNNSHTSRDSSASSNVRVPDDRILYRWNQLGKLPNLESSVVVLVPKPREAQSALVLDSKKKPLKNKAALLPISQKELNAYNAYTFLLPALPKGKYFFSLSSTKKEPFPPQSFEVKNQDLFPILKLSKDFFSQQRCGSASKDRSKACHLKPLSVSEDAEVGEKEKNGEKKVTIPGGWHDAGDYIRYVLTSSFATILMLEAADTAHLPSKMQKEILTEVEWGLKWLDNMWPEKERFYYQIGDKTDHETWRLPEKDDPSPKIQKIYLVEKGKGANLAGRVVASMALYSRMIRKDPKRLAESKKWEKRAVELYEWSKDFQESQSATNNFYNEKAWKDDRALANLELYSLTKEKKYLDAAVELLANLENPFTFDYGNVHMLAFYKLGKYSSSHRSKAMAEMKKMLDTYSQKSQKHFFGAAVDHFFWGSHMHIMGVALTALWHDQLDSKKTFSSLALWQWDYLFGKNAWGKTFVSGAGKESIGNPHHQIAQIKRKVLKGYWSPGPVPLQPWKENAITLKEKDSLAPFQTPDAVLHLDSADYVTNEPALTTSAVGLLLTATMQQYLKGK